MTSSSLPSSGCIDQPASVGLRVAWRAAWIAASVAPLAIHLPLYAAPAFHHRVAAGATAEECTQLSVGESLHYSFKSTGVVDFNIHFHKGKHVEYPVKRTAVDDVEDAFQAGSTQQYCLMWTNRTSEAVVVDGKLR